MAGDVPLIGTKPSWYVVFRNIQTCTTKSQIHNPLKIAEAWRQQVYLFWGGRKLTGLQNFKELKNWPTTNPVSLKQYKNKTKKKVRENGLNKEDE